MLYITKIVKVDTHNNIIGIRQIINSNKKELGKVLHIDPITIRGIKERTIKCRNEVVNLAKHILKPSVYEDTRHIIDNLRAITKPGCSISMSNYASKETSPLSAVKISYEWRVPAVVIALADVFQIIQL